MTAEPTDAQVIPLRPRRDAEDRPIRPEWTGRAGRRRADRPTVGASGGPAARPDTPTDHPTPDPDLEKTQVIRRRRLPTLPSGIGAATLAVPARCACCVGRGIKAGGDRFGEWASEKGHKAERAKKTLWWVVGGVAVLYVTAPYGLLCLLTVGAIAAVVAGRRVPPAVSGGADAPGRTFTGPTAPRADTSGNEPTIPADHPTPPPLPDYTVADHPTDSTDGASRYSGPAMTARITPATLTAEALPTLLAQAGIIRPADRRLVVVEGEPTRHPTGAVSASMLLPPGADAEEVIAQARVVASALGVGKMLVGLSADPEHAGRLELYVADADPFTESVPSPLVGREEELSVWERLPVGWDVRMDSVALRLVDASMLIAGEPRAGKSVALSEIIAAFALDPSADLFLFDGKGAGDQAVWRPVARVFCKRNAEMLRVHLEWAVEEMERRFDALEEDGRDTKLTPEIAEDLGFNVSLLAVDETRYYMSDPTHGKAIARLAVDLAARGPAAGMISAWATQYMDKTAIPPQLKGVCSLRWAFRTPDAVASNLVLGPGAVGRGYNSSRIPRVTHRGVSILDADGDEPQMMRTHYLTPAELREIADTATALRGGPVEASEPAAADADGAQVLERALAALADNEDRVERDDLAERLDVDPDDLRARLRTAGAGAPQSMRINGVPNARGWYRRVLEEALDAVTDAPP